MTSWLKQSPLSISISPRGASSCHGPGTYPPSDEKPHHQHTATWDTWSKRAKHAHCVALLAVVLLTCSAPCQGFYSSGLRSSCPPFKDYTALHWSI
eukprot:CAMPEP_0202909894 /NCGR_PEP_ID=MMETSP1392-20130828/50546_1 /ASSEMBLY_ACC=CAM_ASM_000868 /TAXON_ID=225041 /ORGANISM="Chlamydomonas chlamydogama, Strain SAG 11-48b" /LENGTH=95 /DNA_ID=CAMNT_0049599791 /DNA_START=191 /DNA_END=475 /DNA_ORIENTATION=+